VLTRSISSKRKALLTARATYMKAAPTPSEARLWAALVNGKLGVSFRRQAVIGGYIVDFVAPSVRLVVEVDGGCHAGKRRADARCDKRLGRLGYQILRVEAGVVMQDLPAVVAIVHGAVARLAR
jgi:very-short-patch-repair endonuclease